MLPAHLLDEQNRGDAWLASLQSNVVKKVNETLSSIAYKNLIELPRMIKCVFGKRYFFFNMGIA